MQQSETQFDALIVGLGKTGMSCVRFLSEQGLSMLVTDTRLEPPYINDLKNEFPNLRFVHGELTEEQCNCAEMIVVSPGVSLNTSALKTAIAQGKTVVGDIELFSRQAKAPIVAITGSNGKSTVTTLLDLMAKADGKQVETGGNIGTPALDLLKAPLPQFYILELSSFQLETTFSMNAYASVVLNISSDHMDRYDDIEQYVAAKQKIYAGNGSAVINLDDEYVADMLSAGDVLTFTSHEETNADCYVANYKDEEWLFIQSVPIISVASLGLKGTHNISNALAAIALASTMNISSSAMKQVLESFTGLPHRCQLVAEINGVAWINDSKATNVGACIAAIEGLNNPGKVLLIVGGDSKGAELDDLLPVFEEHIKHVFILGKDSERFVQLIKGRIEYSLVRDIQEAVQQADVIANTGDCVLLAPACASLDMFENYQQRGDVFITAVSDRNQF